MTLWLRVLRQKWLFSLKTFPTTSLACQMFCIERSNHVRASKALEKSSGLGSLCQKFWLFCGLVRFGSPMMSSLHSSSHRRLFFVQPTGQYKALRFYLQKPFLTKFILKCVSEMFQAPDSCYVINTEQMLYGRCNDLIKNSTELH